MTTSVALPMRQLDVSLLVQPTSGDRDEVVSSGTHRMWVLELEGYLLAADVASPTVTLCNLQNRHVLDVGCVLSPRPSQQPSGDLIGISNHPSADACVLPFAISGCFRSVDSQDTATISSVILVMLSHDPVAVRHVILVMCLSYGYAAPDIASPSPRTVLGIVAIALARFLARCLRVQCAPSHSLGVFAVSAPRVAPIAEPLVTMVVAQRLISATAEAHLALWQFRVPFHSSYFTVSQRTA